MKHPEPEQSVLPLFFRDRDLNDNSITPMDICRAITNVVGASKLDGLQKINSVWRVYLKDRQVRLELCVKPLSINGHQVTLLDQNPNVTFSGSGISAQKKDKLTIKNLPLSVSNEEVVKFLKENNIVLASAVRYGMIRDEGGLLTSYKSEDRYVYVNPFEPPLPKQQDIGIFKCLVLHHGKMFQCKACGEYGHKVGEEQCKARPKVSIVAFKGYTHPLSNHFPCNISLFGKTFKSTEHIFFWRMAMEMGKKDLADEIYAARHAGEAKRLGKTIAPDDIRWEWEEKNVDLMKSLLEAKAKQCTEFKSCLLENSGKVFAEATPSKLWATGMSPFLTENTAPEFWLGRNLLGALLGELAAQLSSNGPEHMDLTPSSSSPSDETTLIGSQITPIQQNDPNKDTDHKSDHERDNVTCND